MGFSLSWFAVRGKPASSVREQAGLNSTGQWEEFPEHPYVGVELPGGWYVVVCTPISERFTGAGLLERLSADGEVVSGLVDERSMVSWASGWSQGRHQWSISHDASKGADHLSASGKLPEVFSLSADGARQAQAEDDETDYLFNVPVEVAESLTGFRYDQNPPVDGATPFEILDLGLLGGGTSPVLEGFSLEVEGFPNVASPTREQVRQAVSLMSPRGGPSFVIMDRSADGYIQAAGGDGVFTVECREYQGEAFHHWVAGKPGLHLPIKAVVPTHGSQVKVNLNERLNAADVNELLLGYAENRKRSDRYRWRETTSQFTAN